MSATTLDQSSKKEIHYTKENMEDNLHTGKEALTKLMDGIKKVSTAVGGTMGTSGSNSLIQVPERPKYYGTNDGFSIANSIELADPIEDMGRNILLESINRANRQSGDGSSTTCVLTAAILEEGMKHIGETSPMALKRSLEACIPFIEQSIHNQKKDITVDTVAQVASISAEDEGIGNLIQEIYQQIGKDGIVSWDVSKTSEDSYSIGTGITINGATCVASYMFDEQNEVRLTNPKILLARKKITTALDFESLFPALFEKEIKEIVVFCNEIEPQVLSDLFKTQQIRGFKTIVIKMPILWNDEWWEDLAKTTGGTIIDAFSGLKINEAQLEHLGTVEHIVVTKEDTFLDGIQDVSKHTLSLQVEGTDQSLQRAARLNTKTARYFVGAHSESALAYRRLKVEDALGAASLALEGGIVAGGGVTLKNVATQLGNKRGAIGAKILKKALFAPFNKIINNAGIDWTKYNFPDEETGIDSSNGNQVNMFNAGIVDPANVVLNAVRNAIGVAAIILTTNTVITLPKE